MCGHKRNRGARLLWMKPTESQIEQSICQWLHFNNFFVAKVKDQTAYRDGKYHKPLPFQVNGFSDLVAIRNGQVFFIEVKSQTGVQSKAQKEFEKNIEMHGGVYLLVKSVEDLRFKLESYL